MHHTASITIAVITNTSQHQLHVAHSIPLGAMPLCLTLWHIVHPAASLSTVLRTHMHMTTMPTARLCLSSYAAGTDYSTVHLRQTAPEQVQTKVPIVTILKPTLSGTNSYMTAQQIKL